MRIIDYIKSATLRLEQAPLSYGHGTANAADDAWYLVLGTLNLPFTVAEAHLEKDLEAGELDLLESRLRKRIEANMPVAYLVGKAGFAGHSFKIDSRALIPRSPIGELVTNRFQALLKSEPSSILDMCTGCGCIGIASALTFPQAQVDLADNSAAALELARENIDYYDLGGRVKAIESDLFTGIGQTYDLIVCNPPYVSSEEVDQLPAEYSHEPVNALLSADEGLAIPLRILSQAGDYLRENGCLILEVGYSHHALSDRMPRVPFLWLEFEHGGEGVFMLTRSQLIEYRDCFN